MLLQERRDELNTDGVRREAAEISFSRLIELQAPRFTSIANVATEQAGAFSVAAATT